MDQKARQIMEEIQRNSQISIEQIYDVANAIQYEDLSDEMTVRSLVRRLANLAGRPISADTEDNIVHSIINNDMPSSMDGLNRFF